MRFAHEYKGLKKSKRQFLSACRSLLIVGIGTGLLLGSGHAAAFTATETYNDYSGMFRRTAGQYWADGRAAGQWGWKPGVNSKNVSEINWGDPKPWPPQYAEKFIHIGNWVLLDGWTDNNTYYKIRVTSEQIGDAKCQALRPLGSQDGISSSDGSRQHYVRWNISSRAYCLKSDGVITEQSSGKTLRFSHTQIWSPPAACQNKYYSGQTCIKQWESWWDNRGAPANSPPKRVFDRDAYLARGKGMAFIIEQWYPSHWRADLRYFWSW